MKRERSEVYEDLGKVVFTKKTGVKRLVIRVKNNGEISVTLPYFISYKHAEEFLFSKKGWINKTKNRIYIDKRKAIIDANSGYKTFNHTLRILISEKDKLKKKISYPYLDIFVPYNMDVQSDDCQAFIKNAIEETYRKEAWDYLPGRLKYLADKFSFNYSRLSIKKMKTRWGSCSVKNKINLNLYLMALPEHLSDYIILHELLHTKVKNHSKEFWDKLEIICPGAIQFRKELRNYKILNNL